MARVCRVLLVGVLILISLPLFARHRLTSFEAMILNDNITFGLGENPDDMRSYGLSLSFFHSSGWFADIEASGLTLRGKEAAPSTRYDEIIIQGGYLAHFHFPSDLATTFYDLSLYGGVVLVGNYGFAAIQNFAHDVFNLGLYDAVYEGGGEQRVIPLMGLTQRLEVIEPVPWFKESELFLWAELDLTFSPTYIGKLYPKISLGQHTLSTSQFVAGGGFAFAHILDEWPTHHAVGEAEKGFTLFFKGHIGLITFGYDWYVESMEGYGGLGVQLLFGERLPWVRSDLLISFGLAFPDQVTTTVLRYDIYKDLGLFFKNSYKMIPLSEVANVRENYSTWHVGVDWNIARWDFGWARPYLAGGLGFNRFLVMGDDVAHTRLRLLSEVTFSAEIMMGLRFFNRGEIQYHGSAYGLELTGGLRFSDNSRVDLPGYPLELTQVWSPYVRLSLTVGTLL
ncbi:MAG: hypothetical protein GX842_07810 [Spirochaetales bacterium]|nr:hypothetical protein [Spirochaetales bacterium]